MTKKEERKLREAKVMVRWAKSSVVTMTLFVMADVAAMLLLPMNEPAYSYDGHPTGTTLSIQGGWLTAGAIIPGLALIIFLVWLYCARMDERAAQDQLDDANEKAVNNY